MNTKNRIEFDHHGSIGSTLTKAPVRTGLQALSGPSRPQGFVKIMKGLVAVGALAALAAPMPLFAVEKCGAEVSTGNPMPCSNGGNCVWWTWKKANEAGWAKIPTGNAKTWDDTARANAKLLMTSATPSVGSIGVKESSPYCVETKKGKCTKYEDQGHVAWVTSVNGSDIGTTESNYGVPGVKSVARKASYFNTYIKNTDGAFATDVGCTDGKVLAEKKDSNGNYVALYGSTTCKTRWTVAIAKNASDLVLAEVTRQSPNAKFSAAGRGKSISPMTQVVSGKACTGAKFKSQTMAQVCAS